MLSIFELPTPILQKLYIFEKPDMEYAANQSMVEFVKAVWTKTLCMLFEESLKKALRKK